MSSLNKILLIGNVGADPEVKHLETNTVAKFTLATSEAYKGKDGEKMTDTQWHNIVAWKGLAEIAEKYIRKGSQLYIEGRIKYRTYGEGNEKKYFTEIVADSIQMLGKKPEENN